MSPSHLARPFSFSEMSAFKLSDAPRISLSRLSFIEGMSLGSAKLSSDIAPHLTASPRETSRRHWKIVSDASVNGGYELVSPVLKGQRGLDEVKAVSEALAEVGAMINKSCGFHSHFGTDDFKDSISVWRNLYINYATLEEDIDAFMPPSRRHNRYCSSLKVRGWRSKMENAQTLVDLERAVTNRSRYFKLNSQSYWRHGTVEFRQHSGTIEFDKIKNWLLFCARFVDFSKREKLDRGGERALEKFLDRDLAAFYKQRKQKFERR